jgi:hypothetical protein
VHQFVGQQNMLTKTTVSDISETSLSPDYLFFAIFLHHSTSYFTRDVFSCSSFYNGLPSEHLAREEFSRPQNVAHFA